MKSVSRGEWGDNLIIRDRLFKSGVFLLLQFAFAAALSGSASAGIYRSGQVVRTQLGGNVRILRQFTGNELRLAGLASCFVNKAFGRNLPLAPFQDVYIVNFEKAVWGLTYRPFMGKPAVFIAESIAQAGEKALISMQSLGVTLAHESDHYLFDTKDPDVERRIDDPVSDALSRALMDREQGNCALPSGVAWAYKNRLQRLACECGFDLSKGF